ncbi:FadR/GntR family transcriptional regulator [Nocardioides sp. Kera G14]|uniref:FadR/GntR family transcriptional regulator n=1 Tax=Nocardioides sp. Kera G14 TaxID=2884264 RepID=UPI001D113600|nr:FCD domain-containing protein [Nocardioides sp. Kera G14]UDY24270.1 FCD domain-containing protein [Nocardioides sp. Kera G14]
MALGSPRARETVRRLQADVTSGRWPVNSRIPTEAQLAAELGVGRSTIREAIRSLAHLGLLEPAPGRGTFVRSLSPVRDVLSGFAAEHTWGDILAVRRALEVQAAELAAVRPDSEAVAALRAVHQADLDGTAGVERGRAPGQFHALLVELSGNRLLVELYAGLSAAIRDGLDRGAIEPGEDAAGRQDDHAALVAAIAAGNPQAAAAVAAMHAARDLRVVES